MKCVKLIIRDVWLKETNEFGGCFLTYTVKSSLTMCSEQKPKWVRINGGGRWELVGLVEGEVRPCVARGEVVVDAFSCEFGIMINYVVTKLA